MIDKKDKKIKNNVFDFETNFITCKCMKPEIYPPDLGDGGYDWCKECDLPLCKNID